MNRVFAFIVAMLIATVAQVFIAGPSRSDNIEVDVQLVLAADTSGSMGASLRDAQRRGFAAAFRDLSLQRTIMSGPVGRIAVAYFEWAGESDQDLIVPWKILATPEDMERFAEALETRSMEIRGGETSISGAVRFAAQLLRQNGYVSHRKVVDISGNGKHSQGTGLDLALRALRADGVTVNGLVLPDLASRQDVPYSALFAGYDGPLVDYYRREVIGGPGAFAIEVNPPEGLRNAILRKLTTEIAWADPGE